MYVTGLASADITGHWSTFMIPVVVHHEIIHTKHVASLEDYHIM